MGEVLSFRFQQSDRERVIDIVDMYNVWTDANKYRTCPHYNLNRHIRTGKQELTQFLKAISESEINPEEFAIVLKCIDESIFLQSLIKIDNLFYWLFKKRNGVYNYVSVTEELYKNRQNQTEGELSYLTPEEAEKKIKTDFADWNIITKD